MDSDPTPGNPEEIRELAEDLQEFADDVGEALGKIRGMASDRAVADWAGLSADAFRAEFDGVPENLTKLQTSYDMAADALARYWPRLENAQGMADRALESAIAAQDDLRAAQSELGDAQDWVSRAGDEAERLQDEGNAPEPPDEQAVRDAVRDHQAAEAAAGAAQSRVDAAEQRLAAARELAGQARELREEAARECARDIDAASDAGIQNRSWWEDAVNWVTENWDTFVDICKLVVAVLGIVVMIIGGPLAWVVLAAALVVLADTLVKYANGQATLWDVAFAALDCIPGMKGLTTLGGLARGLRGGLAAARTGLRGLGQGVRGLGQALRRMGRQGDNLVCRTDPIDMATGEMVMDHTDVELPGVLPLLFRRHHRTSLREGTCFGRTWASTLDQRLVLDASGLRLITADGMILDYPRPIPDQPVLPVEGPRWALSWDGQPGTPITVHQHERNRILHFGPVAGRPGGELPLTAITDRNDNRVRVEYDAATGAPTDVIHDGGYHIGVTTRRRRITELRLLSAPDQPVLRRYGYDDAGNLTAVYNSSGRPLRLTYDEHRRITGWEDRNGTWFRYVYDDAGRCVETRGIDGILSSTIEYDTENHRTVFTDSLGNTTVFQFNDAYQLVSESDPLGNTTYRTWDRYDRLQSLTDPLGNTTRLDYDDAAHTTVITRPDGARIHTQYNDFGAPTEIAQPDGTVWQHAYDGNGNQLVLADPAGNRTRYAYNDHGALVSMTDPIGDTTRIRVNAAGLPVAITDSRGETLSVSRDAFGRVTEITDALGARTTWTWSTEGKLLRRVDPLGATETWTWDAEGNCLTHTDRTGGVSRFVYGPFDQLNARVDPNGARHEYVRDAELRILQVARPGAVDWNYTYDAAGRLVAESDFDGRNVTYRYDAAGRLTTSTNATGQSVTYQHDTLGRVIEKHVDDRITSYRYDLLGRLAHATGPDAEMTIERDPLGRVLSESVNGRTTVHTYDALGRPLTRTTPSGHTSTWTYGTAGHTASLITGAHTLTFDEDPAGRETGRRVGDTVLNQSWDSSGRLTEQSLSRGSQMLRHRAYTYSPDHHVTSIRDLTEGTTDFTLDPAGRITEVSGSRTESYTYDMVGNQASAQWPGHPQDDAPATGPRAYAGTRVTRAGAVRYAYDDAGRTILRQKSRLSKKRDTWRYVWDAEDRLTELTTPDGTRWRYQYDPLGRRIAKLRLDGAGDIAEQTLFTWSGDVLVEQQTTGGEHGTATTLTWDYRGLHPVAQTELTPQSEVDRRFYAIVTDLVGSPTELVDETGEIAWQSRTTVWGSAVGSSDGTADTPLRFPGQYHDPETGWHYNYHRHYDPAIARYTSPDPLGLLPAANPYGYAPNPHVWVDPLGLKCDHIALGSRYHGLEDFAERIGARHLLRDRDWRGTVFTAGELLQIDYPGARVSFMLDGLPGGNPVEILNQARHADVLGRATPTQWELSVMNDLGVLDKIDFYLDGNLLDAPFA
ncbi:RHS repeat-associated core domain-containing protein [Streptomyces litchfieldiae]|uniref:RHS repeat-associated core domain-containing protein n=1 Tax=Streptomyces litchfieldiae TaxID=3075543 RepID=A0ABU2MWL0_9ACTN|nr:RHS repeat-associated core domain-containing protein [Streptomyces sp. DSM 44938]MDT0345990.1 RHS repeat-associated core domain-containing protein [Streptomyces sp. DSM 44938]